MEIARKENERKEIERDDFQRTYTTVYRTVNSLYTVSFKGPRNHVTFVERLTAEGAWQSCLYLRLLLYTLYIRLLNCFL